MQLTRNKSEAWWEGVTQETMILTWKNPVIVTWALKNPSEDKICTSQSKLQALSD